MDYSSDYRTIRIETELSLAHAGAASPGQECEMLFERAFGMDRLQAFMKQSERPEPEKLDALLALLKERCSGTPIQYVLGEAYFCGLRLFVDSRVLIPRPETEELVELAKELAGEILEKRGSQDAAERPLRVLDLCTGSGAIACAMAAAFPGAEISASDISEDALALASRNFAAFPNIRALRSDLFDGFPPESFDLVLSNPPYIPSETVEALEASVKDCEPRLALDGGEDGLWIVRRILAEAPGFMAPGAPLLMEIGDDQGEAARLEAEKAGFEGARVRQDLRGRDRMLLCFRSR